MRDLLSVASLKFYRVITLVLISFMVLGLVVVSMREISTGFYVHAALVVVLSGLLLFYPKRETFFIKSFIMSVATIYFYTLFILYPETSSTLILLCIIPGISILFFHPTLFYFSIILNGVFMTLSFLYIYLVDKGITYPGIYMDLTGNIINFFGSQVLLFLIFYLSHERIRKQQTYYEQIQQAERLKTSGQLAAAVAHEIRNPITVVKGFIQFYEQDQSVKREMKEHFSLILDELKVAETVISDFLSIAKPKVEVESNVVNVKNSLHSVVDLINSYALLNSITITLDVEQDCYIACGLMEFKQLLINLLKNAIEASPYGASLSISAKQKERKVEIEIVDEGNGMTKEELQSIGTPYYSLKSKGTGLGLMICFNIVQKYNGDIHFKSEKGKGTTVTVSFPSNKNN